MLARIYVVAVRSHNVFDFVACISTVFVNFIMILLHRSGWH